MNGRKVRTLNPKILLWWVAVISLAISAALFFFLRDQAELDIQVRQKRLLFPMVGVIVAGVCIIAGTAGRWFQSK